MVKDKLEKNLITLLLFTILAFPSLHDLPINGLPLNTFLELFLFSLVLILSRIIYSENKKVVFVFILLLLVSKIILLIEPPSHWKTCFIDDLSRVTEKFEFEDIDVLCEKKFSLLTSKISGYEPVIDFDSLDSKQSWRGANNSTFPLSFFNSKKFNFDRRYEPRREWLPFRAILYANIDSEINYLKFDYIGQVSVKLDNRYTGFGLPDSYLDKTSFILELPNNIESIKVDYRFNKVPPILWDSTLQVGYPEDPYAKLVIFGSADGTEWSLLKNKTGTTLIFAYYLFIFNCLGIFVFTLYKKLEHISLFHFYHASFLVFLFLLHRNIDLLRELPVIGIIDLSTLFLLCIAIVYFILLRKDLNNYSLLIFCYLINLLLVDYPWAKLDSYIRPGGSDSLTYESQARLIMLGDRLRGGEDIFFYSPGYRYVLNILHVFFGEKWMVAWYSLIATCLFFFLKTSIELLPSTNYINLFSLMLGFIYITSNAMQRVFRFGMSEIVSVSLLSILLYLIFSDTHMTYFLKVLSGAFIGLGIIVRPDWLLGFAALLIFDKFRNRTVYLLSIGISLLPLIHNLAYGKKFIIFSTAATYSRNLLVDTSSINSFIATLIETMGRNLPYLLMNPFNQDVSGRVGSIIPFVFLLVLLSCFCLILIRFKELSNLNTLTMSLVIIGFFAPFFLYDPVLFYPRHVLGAHISILFFLVYLSTPIYKDFSFRVITKETI